MRALVKKEGHEFDLVLVKPYFRTLNGHFVKESKIFPFYDFHKHWVYSITEQKFLGLEFFLTVGWKLLIISGLMIE